MTLLATRVEGQQQLQHKLLALTTALDVQTLLDQSASLLLHNIMFRFLRAVDTQGQAFAPITPAREQVKEKLYGDKSTPLFASGKLFHSLQVFQVGADSRGIGTDVPYGKFHQFGTIKLPVREFLGFSKPDIQVVQDLLIHRVVEALRVQ
jgi:phage gpG-like protein